MLEMTKPLILAVATTSFNTNNQTISMNTVYFTSPADGISICYKSAKIVTENKLGSTTKL
jgi:hypothetical protein